MYLRIACVNTWLYFSFRASACFMFIRVAVYFAPRMFPVCGELVKSNSALLWHHGISCDWCHCGGCIILGKTLWVSLLGLLAKIMCSICSFQNNIWNAAHRAASILIWFLDDRPWNRGLPRPGHGLARFCTTAGIGPHSPLGEINKNKVRFDFQLLFCWDCLEFVLFVNKSRMVSTLTSATPA